MARKKVAYVAGVLEDWRHLSMFENLRDFDVEVHAISQQEILSHYRSNLKLFIYENVTDMPGYMRGIEERISDSNIIVSREISRLSTFQATRIAQKYDIPIVNFGHAGNGNIHVNLLTDPDDAQLQIKATDCLEEVFQLVLDLEGTLSGEHGIGLVKKEYIAKELDQVSLNYMRAIKQQFDPDNIELFKFYFA